MSAARNARLTYSVLLVLSLIWGLAFVAIRRADQELSPVNLSLARWLIVSTLYLVLLPVIGRPKTKLEWKDVPRLLVLALATVPGYNLALNYAEVGVSAGLAGLLNSFGPVFTVTLSVLVLQERAGMKVFAGLVMAVLGSIVLSWGAMTLSDLSSLAGVVEAILAAFCYASFAVLGKPLVNKYGSAPTTIIAGLVGTAMIAPLLSGTFVTQVSALSADGWISILYLSTMVTVFGYLLFYTLLGRGAVSRLSIQLYLVPVISVVGDVAFLGEPVTLLMVAGGLLMLVAVALSTWK